MPTPVIDPTERHPDDIADATAYQPADAVWVWPPHAGQWRPGVVDTNSHIALLVRYQLPGGGPASTLYSRATSWPVWSPQTLMAPRPFQSDHATSAPFSRDPQPQCDQPFLMQKDDCG